MMWFALIAALLGMSALTIIQTPREWLKRPLPLALLILFHAAGIASILLILFAVYRMQDGPLRELIIRIVRNESAGLAIIIIPRISPRILSISEK